MRAPGPATVPWQAGTAVALAIAIPLATWALALPSTDGRGYFNNDGSPFGMAGAVALVACLAVVAVASRQGLVARIVRAAAAGIAAAFATTQLFLLLDVLAGSEGAPDYDAFVHAESFSAAMAPWIAAAVLVSPLPPSGHALWAVARGVFVALAVALLYGALAPQAQGLRPPAGPPLAFAVGALLVPVLLPWGVWLDGLAAWGRAVRTGLVASRVLRP